MVEKISWYGPADLFKFPLKTFLSKRKPPEDYLFLCGSASLPRPSLHTSRPKKIWGHVWDYNQFLQLRGQGSSKKQIVFIDSGLTGSNPDFMFNHDNYCISTSLIL